MDKVYIVYEGHWIDMDWENEGGPDKMVAIYPSEDMARHHLELWVSKMLPVIDSWNDEIKRRTEADNQRLKEAGMRVNLEYCPWIPKVDEDPWARGFVLGDEEIYCYYCEHEVLDEVRLE